MERITLSFDIEKSHMNYEGASDLRDDISTRVNKALKSANSGKWVGGSYTKEYIEIFFKVVDYQQALSVIQTTLKDHWLLPLMKITRRSDQKPRHR
jgi:hypothetical protein